MTSEETHCGNNQSQRSNANADHANIIVSSKESSSLQNLQTHPPAHCQHTWNDKSGKEKKTDKWRRKTCTCKEATPSSSKTSQSQAVAFSQSTRWIAVANGRNELNAAKHQSSVRSVPGDGAMDNPFHCFRNCHRLTTAHPSARCIVSLHWNVGSSRVIESWYAHPFSPVLQTSFWVVWNQMPVWQCFRQSNVPARDISEMWATDCGE